jgi:hypothetical protein
MQTCGGASAARRGITLYQVGAPRQLVGRAAFCYDALLI